MKGLNFIYEKDQLIYSIDNNLQSMEDFTIEYYDFDNNSIDDFIDYLNFMEFSSYTFVNFGEMNRIVKLIKYLEKKTLVKLKVISLKEIKINNNYKVKIENEFTNNINIHKIANMDMSKTFENGVKSMLSNVYPENIRKGLIKHIYVDKKSSVENINESIIDNMAINSSFIYEKNLKNNNKFKFIIEQDINNFNISPLYLSESDIYNSIKYFVSHGKINLNNSLIKNYGSILGISKMNCLYVFNNSIYLDSSESNLLGNLTDTYNTVLNNFSLINYNNLFNQFSIYLKKIFLLLVDISNIYGENLIFLTTANNYEIEANGLEDNKNNWIAFFNVKKEKYYTYNIYTNKLYKVNYEVISLFEYVIKDKLTLSNDFTKATKLKDRLDNE